MKPSRAILRVLFVFVAVSVIQAFAGMLATKLIPVRFPIDENMARQMFQWMFLTNAVTVTALSVLALRSEWRGWRLGAAVAAVPLVIEMVNEVEGILFLPNSPIPWGTVFVQIVIATALAVPVWMLLFGRRAATLEPHYHPIVEKSRSERVWKFLVSDVSYTVFYFIAGTMIFPYIRDFYASQKLPSMPAILALELLVRGPVFVVLCLMLVRMLGLPRLQGALAAGVLFTVLSGVAPLLMPNPYFPDSVRWAHLCEVSSSNFVFGMLVAWLWGQPKRVQPVALQQAA
jgi:hypothetical protein